MGAREHRFLRRMRVVLARDFARAFREGSRARGELVTVVVVPNELEHTRLGLSIGKRVWKRAVRRNRVRRVFREAFRLSYGELPRGVDVVIVGSQPRIEPRLEDAQRELVRLVPKALRRWRERRGGASAEGGP